MALLLVWSSWLCEIVWVKSELDGLDTCQISYFVIMGSCNMQPWVALQQLSHSLGFISVGGFIVLTYLCLSWHGLSFAHQSWSGHTPWTCGVLAVSCTNSTRGAHSSRRTATENTWPWWKSTSGGFLRQWSKEAPARKCLQLQFFCFSSLESPF